MHHLHIYFLLYIAVESLLLFYCLVSHAYFVLAEMARAFSVPLLKQLKHLWVWSTVVMDVIMKVKRTDVEEKKESETEINMGSEKKK